MRWRASRYPLRLQALPLAGIHGHDGCMRSGPFFLRWVSSGVAAIVLLPVLGQWFVAAADDLGLYRQPVERAEHMIAR